MDRLHLTLTIYPTYRNSSIVEQQLEVTNASADYSLIL